MIVIFDVFVVCLWVSFVSFDQMVIVFDICWL